MESNVDIFILNDCHPTLCYRTRLSLSLSERRDEGTYYCVSKNELGITRGNIQVFSEYLVQSSEGRIHKLNKILPECLSFSHFFSPQYFFLHDVN